MEAPKDIDIVPCRPEHWGEIADIYNDYIREGKSTMERRLHEAQDIEAWVAKFHDRENLYVLLKDQSVLGWGIIKRYSDREGYSLTCETAIYLRRSEMRKGYGSIMKRFLIAECQAMNYHHLVAKIFATNEASIQYNLKLGYTIVGRQKEIGRLNGDWMDIVIMQYIIPQS
jgi:phosphinothricin acetyltransferase